ncbi:putative olfactory receptor 13C6 [Callorhinchus milii]|uniref:putative olfactory receptor 13C6 n=1 Tax=Callorhinchus milii TaxID=7868 RepID=UPI001C3FBBE3|nr:putative olfactory receptor 13C6 [Callorhinchus milii]
MENGSSAFYLSTFEASYSMQMVIFGLCLLLYVITVVANLLVFVAVLMCPELHKPMYFFLGNMALVDIIGCTSSVPKQLQILLTGDTKILYESCLVQMFCVHVFANFESLTLSLMAFDRYVAICHPLRYHTIVTAKKTLGVLVLIWVIASPACMALALLVTPLNFSDDNRKIQGYFVITWASLHWLNQTSRLAMHMGRR